MEGQRTYGLTIDECNFATVTTDSGKFVGKVREFPKLRSRPQKSSIDAIDEIVSMTRDKLRRLDALAAGDGPAPWTANGT